MSELRQDPTTKVWVIVAPERAKRLRKGPKRKQVTELPKWDAACPFCPGNEDQTSRETFRLPLSGENTEWDLRVFANRYAAVNPQGDTARIEHGHFVRKMGGYGIHEVIVESPLHNTTLALMSCEQVEKILIAYQERYNTLRKDPQIQAITIFKNHGWAAGISMLHPHSQLVATPILAPYYNRKFDVAHEYYADIGKCLFCKLLDWELDKKVRVVAETREFVVIHPYASRVPYETWIIPKSHYASFGLYPSTNLTELARVLKDVLFCLYQKLDNPAYNFMIDSTTTGDEESPFYHWHLRIIPRLSTIAGFEMGSGMYVTTAVPEKTARIAKRFIDSLGKTGEVSIKSGK